jgi:hypothetical protein
MSRRTYSGLQLEEAAVLVGCHRRTIENALADGRLVRPLTRAQIQGFRPLAPHRPRLADTPRRVQYRASEARKRERSVR